MLQHYGVFIEEIDVAEIKLPKQIDMERVYKAIVGSFISSHDYYFAFSDFRPLFDKAVDIFSAPEFRISLINKYRCSMSQIFSQELVRFFSGQPIKLYSASEMNEYQNPIKINHPAIIKEKKIGKIAFDITTYFHPNRDVAVCVGLDDVDQFFAEGMFIGANHEFKHEVNINLHDKEYIDYLLPEEFDLDKMVSFVQKCQKPTDIYVILTHKTIQETKKYEVVGRADEKNGITWVNVNGDIKKSTKKLIHELSHLFGAEHTGLITTQKTVFLLKK